MKTIVKTVFAILLGTFFSGSIVVAQEQTPPIQPNPGTQMMRPSFTEEQKAMLKNDLQKRKELREAFKATLTQAQKDMLTDPRMIKSDRIKTFRASLTDQQVIMIKTRNQQIKNMKTEFRSTLTDQQKTQFKRMAGNRVRMHRAILRRARLHHRFGGI